MSYSKFKETLLYQYGFAIFIAVAALGLTALTWEITQDAPFIFFFGAVVLSAWQGGLLAGMVCAAVSTLALDFFLIEPGFSLFTSQGEFLRAVILMLVAVLISWLEDQRNRTERSLRELTEELEVILNGVHEGLAAQDETGRFVFTNAAFIDLLRFPEPSALTNQEALVKHLTQHNQLVNEGGAPLTAADLPFRRVFSSGRTLQTTFGVQANGTTRWMTLQSTPIFDKQGKVRLAVNIFRDVTEQHQVVQVRLESEQRLRKLLDNLGAFVGVMTPDGILIEANRSALQAASLDAHDVLGKPFDQTYWWAYDEQVQAQLRDSIQRAACGETIRYDVKVRLAEDRYITIDFMLAPIFDAAGAVEYLIPSGIDVTARNDLTRLLQVQQWRLETILNSIPVIVYEGYGGTNAGDQHMRFISHYAEQMLGYPLSAWRGAPNFWQRVTHPEDWDEAVRRATESYQNGDSSAIPFRCIAADGRILHVEAYNNVLTDLDGQVIGTCGIVLDVTERRRQEAEISRLNALISHERQRLANIVKNVPGVVYEGVGSPEQGVQRLTFISAYIEKMLGYTPEECLADPKFWQRIVLPEDWQATLDHLARIFEDGHSGTLQFRCFAKDGRLVYVEAHSSLLCDEQNTPNGVVGMMMDISERHQIETEIAHYAEDLRRSNQELEQFAYVASHDLQEPLRMVTSYLQLIEQRYAAKLDSDAKEFIAFAVDGATRMKLLINSLLAYSRIQRNDAEFERVSLAATLEQVLHNLQFAIQDTQAVITYDTLPEISANAMQMIQLLQNLIGNALKFRKPDQPPQIHIGAVRERGYWHLTISDNGIGIEADYLERIFVIFQRLHARNEYEGTGIGLAICRKIVDKHNGQIYAESIPNEGTTFHVKLPIDRSRRRITHGTPYSNLAG